MALFKQNNLLYICIVKAHPPVLPSQDMKPIPTFFRKIGTFPSFSCTQCYSVIKRDLVFHLCTVTFFTIKIVTPAMLFMHPNAHATYYTRVSTSPKNMNKGWGTNESRKKVTCHIFDSGPFSCYH